MGQLWALSPWTRRGLQEMVQTRSMTRIAEERWKQEGSLHGHLRAFSPWTMMLDDDDEDDDIDAR